MNQRPNRFRFSLRTLIVGVFVVGVLCAMLTRHETVLMWRFSQADGGAEMYGLSFGWPITFLRVPIGDFADAPADLFLPGLIADLGCAALLVAAPVLAWKAITRTRQRRKAAVA